MRMTPKCIFPSRNLLLSSRFVYPIVFLTSLLTIWLKYSSHLIHQKWKSWFPPLLKSVYSGLFISANGTTIYPVVQARNLKASLICPLFASYSTYNPSPNSGVSTSKIYLKYFYICSSSSLPFHHKLHHLSPGWLQQPQTIVSLSICLSFNNLSDLLQYKCKSDQLILLLKPLNSLPSLPVVLKIKDLRDMFLANMSPTLSYFLCFSLTGLLIPGTLCTHAC